MQLRAVEGICNKIRELCLQMGGTRGMLRTSEEVSDESSAEACDVLLDTIRVTFRSLFGLGSSRLEEFFNENG